MCLLPALSCVVVCHVRCGLQLSRMFAAIEERREDLHIQHYSLSQSTLEQGYLSLVKHQDEREEERSISA